jgi:hypothetical protein
MLRQASSTIAYHKASSPVKRTRRRFPENLHQAGILPGIRSGASLGCSFEPDKRAVNRKGKDKYEKNPGHEEIFSHLQQYRAAGLLVPVGEEHLFWAAIHSTACKLTPLGQFYWDLVQGHKI